VAATYDLVGIGVLETEIDTDPNTGLQRSLTSIVLVFSELATVGDINSLLGGVSGKIRSMSQGVPILSIRIPDPKSPAALESVLQILRGSPFVLSASASLFPRTSFLPSGYSTSSPSELNKIRHHLAIRGHAAWNASAAIQPRQPKPTVVVSDRFGDDIPNNDYDVLMPYLSDVNSQKADDSHGYAVLSVIAASFAGGATDSEQVTGMFPAKTTLVVADNTPAGWLFNRRWLNSDQAQVLLLKRIKRTLRKGSNVVVNTSWGTFWDQGKEHPCNPNPTEIHHDVAAELAYHWIKRVEKNGLRDKFVHLAAAANLDFDLRLIDCPELERAAPFTRAGISGGYLRDTFTGAIVATVDRLATTLIVPNVIATATEPFRPKCVHHESSRRLPPGYRGGVLGAIGTNVFVMEDNQKATDYLTGASLAAPQVAGLAEFVWAINPALTPPGVVDILERTARTMTPAMDCVLYALHLAHADDAAQVIDAYAAVLAADTPDKKVRKAILDVDGNLKFDEMDLAKYFNEFSLSGGAIDYSRYDLNGDGHTGGDTVDRFDLDNASPVDWKTVTQTMEGQAVTFDENQITDQQILCYYAYDNSLYTGDPTWRELYCKPKLTVDMVGLGSPPLNKDWSVSVLGSGGLCLMDAHFDVCPKKHFSQLCGLIGLQWGAVVDLTAYVSAGDQCSSWVPHPPSPLWPWWAPDGTCSYFNCASLPPQFVEWGGDCSGTATTTTVKLTSDKHCTVVIRWP
jgi:hypothetical protein